MSHLFAWSFVVLAALGISHTVFEKLFWRRLRLVDPDIGHRLLGTDLANRRSAGTRRLWRLLFKREYAQVSDSLAVRLGDSTLVSYVVFLLVFLSSLYRVYREYIHSTSDVASALRLDDLGNDVSYLPASDILLLVAAIRPPETRASPSRRFLYRNQHSKLSQASTQADIHGVSAWPFTVASGTALTDAALARVA